MPDEALANAKRAVRTFRNQSRRTDQALRALEDDLGRIIAEFPLRPGDILSEDVISLLRLLVAEHTQRGVTVSIKAREGTDQGADNDR